MSKNSKNNGKPIFPCFKSYISLFLDIFYDQNVSINKKRAHLNLYDADNKKEDFIEDSTGTKKIKANMNSWTNKPYSQRYYEILAKRKALPAWEAREQVQMLMNEYQTIILQGETGSGKTTQVPQFLLESTYKSGYGFILWIKK